MRWWEGLPEFRDVPDSGIARPIWCRPVLLGYAHTGHPGGLTSSTKKGKGVERHFGYAVARAYAAGHTRKNDAGPTTTYIQADMHKIASALADHRARAHGPPTPNFGPLKYHGGIK
jgi:hypothetical protein